MTTRAISAPARPLALARLVPNVDHVEWQGLDSSRPLHITCDFSPLTRLVDFSCEWINDDCDDNVAVLQPSAWQSLTKVTGAQGARLRA